MSAAFRPIVLAALVLLLIPGVTAAREAAAGDAAAGNVAGRGDTAAGDTAAGDTATGDVAAAAAPRPLEAVLDSLRQATEASRPWERFVGRTDWDSTGGEWVPSPEGLPTRPSGFTRIRLAPSPRFRFDKVQGATPGVGATLAWGRRAGLRVSGGLDRATSAGRWAGEVTVSLQDDVRASNGPPRVARARLGGGGAQTLAASPFARRAGRAVSLTYAEAAVPFGSNRPQRNGVAALLLSLDGQDYLRREERSVGLALGREALRTEIAYTERRDAALGVALDPPLHTDPGSWANRAADRVLTRGFLAAAGTAIGAPEPLSLTLRAGAFGGALGGDAEYYPLGLELHRAFHPWAAERLDIVAWAGAVPGRPPRQERADLGGVSSLRAHRAGELEGRAATFFRLDYQLGVDLLARLHAGLARRLRLQPTAFIDAGAAWGDTDWTQREEIMGPRSADWRTDLGIGLQRSLGYPGLLDRVRVDFAWRTDRGHDRFRASVRLSP